MTLPFKPIEIGGQTHRHWRANSLSLDTQEQKRMWLVLFRIRLVAFFQNGNSLFLFGYLDELLVGVIAKSLVFKCFFQFLDALTIFALSQFFLNHDLCIFFNDGPMALSIR